MAGASAALMLAALTVRPVRRLQIAGDSMEPTLSAGDRVVVVRRRPRVGDVVAVRQPADESRLVVKRVTERAGDSLWLLGDNPARSTDSRQWGWVGRHRVAGVVLYRYHPERSAGRLDRGGYHRHTCR